MKISKFLLSIAGLFIIGQAQAQMRPGVAAGMNLSNAAISGETNDLSTTSLFGYHFRGLAEFVLTDNISVESGIGLSTKGFNSKSSFSFSFFGVTTTTEVDQNFKLNYLDIPVVLKYGIPMDESRLYLGVGPQLGIGMKGRSKVTSTTTVNGTSTSTEESNEINWKEDDINRFDLGAKALVGFEKNGVFVEAFYEYGLVDLNQSTENSETWQNRCLGLTLGFKLGGY